MQYQILNRTSYRDDLDNALYTSLVVYDDDASSLQSGSHRVERKSLSGVLKPVTYISLPISIFSQQDHTFLLIFLPISCGSLRNSQVLRMNIKRRVEE